ncbi:MAG: HAD-IIB family hydrolase [Phycisphaerales bacterium]|jgi:hypothetical protein|nr:HAD-IIB family hydrolase [Phycisphaerales bacterium]
MGRPELLAIDLDGTLLGAGGTVSGANREALHRATSEGLSYVIATGRTLSECGDILESIDYSGALIAASGALLQDVTAARTLDRLTVPARDVEHAVSHVLETPSLAMLLKDHHTCGVDYLMVGVGDIHPVSAWWFESTGATYKRVERLDDDPWPEDTVRVGAIGSPHACAPMVDAIDAALGDRVLARHWEAVTSSAHHGTAVHLLEVFHPQADKWTMLQSHCRREGLDSERAAAVGDGVNDVLLLQQCGLGVAVENADHRVLAVADAVTGPHHADGVAHLIHDLLDGKLRLAGACAE